MTKALVLLSGGQDSTTCLYWAINEFGQDNVSSVSFDYGQRHRIELECAGKIAEIAGIPNRVLPANTFEALGGNSLTDTLEVETDLDEDTQLPNTFVPGRNLIFLTFAAAYAYQLHVQHLVCGVAQTDYSGYPDCRNETIEALQKAINLGMESDISIHTPLMWKSKAETVAMANELGAMQAMAFSHTCYKGMQPPCGECAACQLRARGFAEAGVADPWCSVSANLRMSEKLYYEAIARFEAALKVDILPEGHRSRGLHGHSFIARARALPCQDPGPYPATELAELSAQMQRCSEVLNYSYLNDSIASPTDENLARWFKRELGREEIVSIGIQSTTDSGADLADNDVAHIWRRFSFEAAHQLPNVPAGHKCGRMHGHGFEVVIHAQQTLSEDEAMGLDFDLIELLWQSLHDQLNYKCLNDIPGLENPTSEHIAAWIWDRLKPELAELSWISIYETRSSGCHYDGRRFRIWKEKSFESALLMRSAPGDSPLHNLHGHSYLVRLHLNGELDEVMGWLVDYGEVKEKFRATWEKIDHHRLDQIDCLDDISPASFLRWMKTEVGGSLPELDRIDLYETPGCGAVLCWGSEVPALPTKAL